MACSRAASAVRRVVLSALVGAAGSYSTLAAPATHEMVVKKSRFVAAAAPVCDPEQALSFVREASDPRARHNCFAWRLPDGSMRTNGDGEPGGTAGPPILAAIDGAGLVGVACVVSRYRLDGGAKLGTGGLVRAYGSAAEACLAAASVVVREPRVVMSVRYTPADTGTVYALLAPFSPTVVTDDDAPAAASDAAACAPLEVTFEAPPEEAERIATELGEATQGRVGGLWTESEDEAFPMPRWVKAGG